jgi:hypothetical protein
MAIDVSMIVISFCANVCFLSRSALVPALSGYQLYMQQGFDHGKIIFISWEKISTPVLLETHKFIRMF